MKKHCYTLPIYAILFLVVGCVIGFKYGKKRGHLLYLSENTRMNIRQFVHLHEAEKLAQKIDGKFPQRSVVFLCGALSAYSEVKASGLETDGASKSKDGFQSDLKKAIDIVRGTKYVQSSPKIIESSGSTTNFCLSVDFSFLLDE
jgi:hypothetical protein